MVRARSSGSTDSIRITGALNGKTTPLVVDSGANRTLVRSDLLPPGTSLPEVPGGLSDVTGGRTTLYGPTEVLFTVGDTNVRQTVYVADNLCDEVILGLDFLESNQCVLDFKRKTLWLEECGVPFLKGTTDTFGRSTPQALRVRVMTPVTVDPCTEVVVHCKPVGQKFNSIGVIETGPLKQDGLVVGRSLIDPHARSVRVLVANVSGDPVRLKTGTTVGVCEPVELVVDADAVHGRQESRTGIEPLPDHLTQLLDDSSRDLTMLERQKVAILLGEYHDVFSSSDNDLGKTSLAEHRIETGDNQPVKVPPRRVPIHKRGEVEDTVKRLSDQGLIEPSTSPWSSALVLVKKKDGSLRCCVDYRLLNAATIKDSYPLPRIDDTLDALVGSKWFSTLDLKSGYHQVPVAEVDRPKTAFSAGNSLWQWRVLPFGLSNAPATFERLMESVLAGMHWRTLLVYLDDIIVFGKTFEEELQRLEEVFRRMRRANLKLSPKKCLLFRSEVPFLGHIVSRDGVRTDPIKTTAVAEWPVPANVTELRSFLGFCTYYRRFVRDFSKLAAPLHDLTKAGVPFKWNSACHAAFENLKEVLTNAPVLQYPDPHKPFILDTDASSVGVGAVLSQVIDGVERVVAYFSRTLSPAERNYCVTRRELLAVLTAVRHFHSYLYGSQFTIRTDHASLQWLHHLKDPEGQLARWLARLGQYSYHIVHRPGERHANADAMSRRPCPDDCGHCLKREKVLGGKCRVIKISPAETTSDERGIRSAQQSDPELAPLLSLLERGTDKPVWEEVASASRVTKLYWAQWEQLQMNDGVLQRRWESRDGLHVQWLDVIPNDLKNSVMMEAHGSVSSGHFGIKKTLQRLRKCSYWVGMRHDVREWCRVCETCMAKKGPQHVPQAPLQIVGVGAPMERVAVDIAGPFPVSSAGNRYIIVVIDYFTKWPEVFAIPNQEARTVAQALVDGFFSRFGMPEELHSDQGRNFESTLFRDCCRLLGIRKTRTTALHPESDGMVERFNRTLVQEIAKRCRHGQNDWDQYIPTILMAYRSAEHESTGYTPAQLMLSRELRLPLDLLLERPPGEERQSPADYVRTQSDRMRAVRVQVERNLKTSAGTMKQRKDLKATLEPLKEGDKVWLYNPKRKKGQSPKLSSSWDGPYLLVKKLSAVTYRIQKNPQAACKVVHFNRLWKVGVSPSFSWAENSNADVAPVARDLSPATAAPSRRRSWHRRGPSEDDSTVTTTDNLSTATPEPVAGDPGPAAVAPRRRSWRRRKPPDYLTYNSHRI